MALLVFLYLMKFACWIFQASILAGDKSILSISETHVQTSARA